MTPTRPLNPDALGELRRMLAEATPGPWEMDGEAIPYRPRQRSAFADQGAGIRAGEIEIVIGGCQDEQGGAVGILKEEDARLIVSAINALPVIIDLAEWAAKYKGWVEPLPEDSGRAKWELHQARIQIKDLHDALHEHAEEIRRLKDALALAEKGRNP